MLTWIVGLFAKKEVKPPLPESGVTPALVEALIDAAGRDEVFALMHANGWSGSNPPLWAWMAACDQVSNSKPRPAVTLH